MPQAYERCWAALENYWNGAILDIVETALRWAANMTWNGFESIVELVDAAYQKGIKVQHSRQFLIGNGGMRVSALFYSGLADEESRVSALVRKSIRTIEGGQR